MKKAALHMQLLIDNHSSTAAENARRAFLDSVEA